jgi:hypothetical protein
LAAYRANPSPALAGAFQTAAQSFEVKNSISV